MCVRRRPFWSCTKRNVSCNSFIRGHWFDCTHSVEDKNKWIKQRSERGTILLELVRGNVVEKRTIQSKMIYERWFNRVPMPTFEWWEFLCWKLTLKKIASLPGIEPTTSSPFRGITNVLSHVYDITERWGHEWFDSRYRRELFRMFIQKFPLKHRNRHVVELPLIFRDIAINYEKFLLLTRGENERNTFEINRSIQKQQFWRDNFASTFGYLVIGENICSTFEVSAYFYFQKND